MPTRTRVEKRLATLRDELTLVTAFQQKWEALTAFTVEMLGQDAISMEEIEKFDEQRGDLNRLLPRVAHRLGKPLALRSQFGVTEQIDVFGFLLETVPHLGSLAGDSILGIEQQYRQRFFETRALANAAVQRAIGALERDIATVEAGPSIIDALADQAAETGITGFLSHLEEAETHFEDDAFEDAIHRSRRAIERLATEIANAVSKTPRKRKFSDAMSALKDVGIVDDATHRSIVTPNVGFWGWTSAIGTHDEDDPAGSFEAGAAEARLAIEHARAIAEYLLSRVTQHLADEDSTS